MESMAENRYWITIGVGLLVAVVLVVYLLVTSRKKSGARKAAARRGKGGVGDRDDGGVSVYQDGPGLPQDNDNSVYRDSDLYGIKGDKKDKEEYYKDWD